MALSPTIHVKDGKVTGAYASQAKNVSYNNDRSVEDALNEARYNNLSTNYVNITSYISSFYEAPSDGYLYVTAKQTSSAAAVIRANIFGKDESMNMFLGTSAIAGGTQGFNSIFLRSGMKVKIDINIDPASANLALFIPLV